MDCGVQCGLCQILGGQVVSSGTPAWFSDVN